MTHRRINFATALSLLVCAAVVALWVRSYVVEDGAGYDEGGTGSRLVVFHSSMGRTWAAVGTGWSEHSRARGWFHSATPAKPLVIWNTDQPLWEPLGIAGGRADSAVFDRSKSRCPTGCSCSASAPSRDGGSFAGVSNGLAAAAGSARSVATICGRRQVGVPSAVRRKNCARLRLNRRGIRRAKGRP